MDAGTALTSNDPTSVTAVDSLAAGPDGGYSAGMESFDAGTAWRRPLVVLALVALLPAILMAAIPETGSAAPDFELPSAAGDTHTLSATLEENAVVLVFYRAFW